MGAVGLALHAGLREPGLLVGLDRWLVWARRSQIAQFVALTRTIATHRDAIRASIEHRASNGRVEAMNTGIRLLTRRAYGFHSPDTLKTATKLRGDSVSSTYYTGWRLETSVRMRLKLYQLSITAATSVFLFTAVETDVGGSELIQLSSSVETIVGGFKTINDLQMDGNGRGVGVANSGLIVQDPDWRLVMSTEELGTGVPAHLEVVDERAIVIGEACAVAVVELSNLVRVMAGGLRHSDCSLHDMHRSIDGAVYIVGEADGASLVLELRDDTLKYVDHPRRLAVTTVWAAPSMVVLAVLNGAGVEFLHYMDDEWLAYDAPNTISWAQSSRTNDGSHIVDIVGHTPEMLWALGGVYDFSIKPRQVSLVFRGDGWVIQYYGDGHMLRDGVVSRDLGTVVAVGSGSAVWIWKSDGWEFAFSSGVSPWGLNAVAEADGILWVGGDGQLISLRDGHWRMFGGSERYLGGSGFEDVQVRGNTLCASGWGGPLRCLDVEDFSAIDFDLPVEYRDRGHLLAMVSDSEVWMTLGVPGASGSITGRIGGAWVVERIPSVLSPRALAYGEAGLFAVTSNDAASVDETRSEVFARDDTGWRILHRTIGTYVRDITVVDGRWVAVGNVVLVGSDDGIVYELDFGPRMDGYDYVSVAATSEHIATATSRRVAVHSFNGELLLEREFAEGECVWDVMVGNGWVAALMDYGMWISLGGVESCVQFPTKQYDTLGFRRMSGGCSASECVFYAAGTFETIIRVRSYVDGPPKTDDNVIFMPIAVYSVPSVG